MSSTRALWRDPDFARLWAAQAVSSFGARITREGLPMTAILVLGASPAALGLLAALSHGPALVVGLAGGGFVDRRRRRPILIGADLVRAAVLIATPLAAWLGVLTLAELFAAALAVGAASILFDMADHAYLPGLVGTERLVEGNARLSATESVAEMGGPALAGLLFQWLTAPVAVAVNAATYLVSAAVLVSIRKPEPAPEAEAPASVLAGVTEGFRLTWSEPRVRALLLGGMVQGLFGGVFSALYILFALKTLGLTPGLLGLAIAADGLGAMSGAALGPWLARRIGVGPAIILSIAGASLSALTISFAPTDRTGAMTVMVLTQVSGDALGVASGLLVASLRQGLMPQAVLGRVAGAFHASAGALTILGALGGGWLGGLVGPRETLRVAALGFFLIPLIGLASPLRRVREIGAPTAGSASTG